MSPLNPSIPSIPVLCIHPAWHDVGHWTPACVASAFCREPPWLRCKTEEVDLVETQRVMGKDVGDSWIPLGINILKEARKKPWPTSKNILTTTDYHPTSLVWNPLIPLTTRCEVPGGSISARPLSTRISPTHTTSKMMSIAQDSKMRTLGCLQKKKTQLDTTVRVRTEVLRSTTWHFAVCANRTNIIEERWEI